MTLPYPYEVETGKLVPRHDPLVDPLNIEGRTRDLVSREGRSLVIAGCQLRVPANKDPEALRAQFRRAIAQRFLNRRPNAGDATWHRFVRALQAQLADRTKIDERTLHEILLLIDGL